MKAVESDWAFLRAAVPELQDYILSKDVYRPLGGAQIPQLTIGNLLLSQARLAALYPAEARPAELNGFAQRIERERSAWRANWAGKAGREYASRINLWSQYLTELRGDPRALAAFYPNEVRHRAILRLLEPEARGEISQKEVDQLNQLDVLLRGLIQPGPFVWDAVLESAFPKEPFWFLYLTVRM